ncbi:MmgE/PrpD family protein [Arthrobacter sp. EPSL27]|uniref:MmgE/PrpD family protein n=1 Tax=Arthrobacter sp. EPSL27 TaxID=1745378 RepID=UPI0007499B97|nr:MmgE/PrpD family protein [Arthrobacter sp. EPSL27]KUM37408.1 hypothetical protein AR539_09095 [Arthrobacter sp. EPSL27]
MPSRENPSLTELLVDLISNEEAFLEEEWATIGERAFVDTVGVTLAGSRQQPVRILDATVEAGEGPVYSIAASRPVASRDAALLDGTSAHALDLDDMDEAYIAHPSAVIFPALWSIGQKVNASGKDLLAAFRVGAITNRVIAAHLDITTHFGAGWHSTSTIGTVGGAAAVSRLLRADATGARNALGIAGSLAAGSRQNFGTMVKPLHAGFAASNAVLAAELGIRGFTSNPEQLSGPIGFLELFRGSSSRIKPTAEVVQRAFVASGFNIKRYPCCYRTHPAIEAAAELAGQIDLSEVTAINVTVQPAGLVPLIHHRPADGSEAKFSIEYTVAAALLDGDVFLSSFDESRVRRPEVQTLLKLVTATESASPPYGSPNWHESFAVVTVTTRDGRIFTARNDVPRGHTGAPLTEGQLRAKFEQCAGFEEQGVPDDVYRPLRALRAERSIRTTIQLISQVKLQDSEDEPCRVDR